MFGPVRQVYTPAIFMSKEIIINADKDQTRIALIEDGELVELHIENTDNERTLGDIYLGRVRRTMPSIQAAFIDIGQKQDAFLHYSDLADNLPQWLKLLEYKKPDVSQMAVELGMVPESSQQGEQDESSRNQRGTRHNRTSRSAKQDLIAENDDQKKGRRSEDNRSDSRTDQETGASKDDRSGSKTGTDERGTRGRGDRGDGDRRNSNQENNDRNSGRRGDSDRQSKGRDRGARNQETREQVDSLEGDTQGRGDGSEGRRNTGREQRGRDDQKRDSGNRGNSRRDNRDRRQQDDDRSQDDRQKRDDGREEKNPADAERKNRGQSSQRRGGPKEQRPASDRRSRDHVSGKDSRSTDRSKGRGSRGGRGRSNRDGSGKPPETYLDKGKRILVKIVKEPISAKGSRVSTDISLAGRFLVLVPLANYVAVSKKIYSYKERRRLRALARSLLPAGFGVIVRTVAEGKKARELDTDLRLLLEKWRKIEKRLEGAPEPPVVVHEDVSMASSVIRDLFSDDYDRILIDDPKLYKNVKNYVQAVAPHMVPAVQQHKGKRPIFKAAKIAHDVNQAFESRVDLPSGGYLFIEHTEAMHVVDVNSGRAGRGLSQEQNSLKVDIEAVHAIAKQIRLRDLGGIIVIDFIDLREERNRKKVYFELKKAFGRDRAVTKILPMSDFGLVEITRQRLRPSITKTFSNDRKDKATGETEVKPVRKERDVRSITIEGFVEKIERWITSYKAKEKKRSVSLQVHPFAAAFLSQKIPAYPTRWFLKYFIRVKLVIDESLDPLGFRFVDPKTGKEISRRSGSRRGRGRSQSRRDNPQRNKNTRGNNAGDNSAGDNRSKKGNNSRRTTSPKSSNPRSNNPRSNNPKSSNPRSNNPRSNNPRSNNPRGNNPRSNNPRSNNPRNSSARDNKNPRGNSAGGAKKSNSNASRSSNKKGDSNKPKRK